MSNGFGLNVAVSNSNSLNQTGFCNACGKKSQCKCDRCGDFYCSVECQKKDWSAHRFICFPMPKLVKVGQAPAMDIDIPNDNIQLKHNGKDNNLSKTNKPLKVENSPKTKSLPEGANLLQKSHIPNGSCVNLVTFKSSNRCAVRSTNPSSVAERNRILKEIDDFGKKSSALSSKPKYYTFALALRNELWSRVQIFDCKNQKCKVLFTDFGVKSFIPIEDLRNSSPSINILPCHIQMVQLKGIPSFSTHQKLLIALNQFVNKEYKIIYSEIDETGGSVELFKWGTSISLNSLIVELSNKQNDNSDFDNKSTVSLSSYVDEVPKTQKSGNEKNCNSKEDEECTNISNGTAKKIKDDSKFGREGNQKKNEVENKIDNSLTAAKPLIKKEPSALRQIQKPCLIPPFEFIPLNENDNVKQVLIMDNSFLESGFVGCILEKHCENLKAVTNFLHEYDAGTQPYKPKANEYCLARFENLWYRAKVDEILSDDEFLVVYIDFTNERELSSDCIRRYPLSLDLACCTTLCGIEGLPDNLSEELKQFLEEELKPFSVIKVDSIRMKNNICYLKSNELLEKLSDSKLI